MSIFNRRNALIGWAAWSVGKQAMKLKARGVVPSSSGKSKSGSAKKAVTAVAVLAAAGGALAFWKAKHGDSTDHDSVASEELG
jgi:hypothetical protein